MSKDHEQKRMAQCEKKSTMMNNLDDKACLEERVRARHPKLRLLTLSRISKISQGSHHKTFQMT